MHISPIVLRRPADDDGLGVVRMTAQLALEQPRAQARFTTRQAALGDVTLRELLAQRTR
jgi:hypothetical protein